MASIRNKKKSKFFWACITGPDGRRIQFSTGLEDKKAAYDAAVAAESALRRHVQRPQQLHVALRRLANDFTPSPHLSISGPQWLRGWATTRQKKIAESSFGNYKSCLHQAADWFEENSILTLDAITQADCDRLLHHWGSINAATTANGKLDILSFVLGDAVSQKIIEDNPAAKVTHLRELKTKRRNYTDAEISIVLARLETDPEWLAMFWLGLNTGQRENDLAVLRQKNLDLVLRTVSFVTAKTGHVVCLPLLPPAFDSLTALPSSDDPEAPLFPRIFAQSEGGRSKAFRRHLASVGLARPVNWKRPAGVTTRQTSELCFHSLRHNATSWLKAAGVPASITRAIIGHSSETMSGVYTHFDIDLMRREMEKVAQFQDLAKSSPA